MLAASLLLALCAPALVGHSSSATAQSQTQITLEDLRGVFERLVTASDKGDRKAFARFSRLYPSLYEQAYFEANANVPKTATEMIPALDHWLAEKAANGSATAQFWMGERTKVLQNFGAKPPDAPEVAQWYRAAAEKGFGPAQDALGQMLGFFPELAHEPFEAEKWLFLAVRQNEPAAAERLLQAIEIDAQRAQYKPDAEITAWLQARADTGDTRARAILDKVIAPD